MKLIRVLTACVCLTTLSALHAQTLEVIPNRILSDEYAAIRASGLQPNERVTIRAELVDGGGQPWASQAEFVTDAQGNLDLSKQAPVQGSYKEVSAMGLIWSMRATAKNVNVYEHPKEFGSQAIRFELARHGEAISRAQLEQLHLGDGVRRFEVEGNLHGVLFVPADNERHPGVLVLGGSEGGLPTPKAAWLASRGFAALALAYFRYEDLPPRLEAIPLEYFGHALAWMMERPDIVADRIAVVGTSRGGELALQLGSMYPQIKAVVAYVPANVRYPACCGNNEVPYAWTWQGHALSYRPLRLVVSPEALLNAKIEVERTQGPIMLISGQEDGVWPSSIMADAVVARLKDHHFSYSVENLEYSHAGHMAGRPEIMPVWRGRNPRLVFGREEDAGGTLAGNAESTLDAMPKVLQFLRQSLETALSQR